jgi:hypothetical protein
MKLNGKVTKIERIVGRFDSKGVADEKRVFHLSVRLPDKSLSAAYSYGYGQMHFILHGQQMEDFVDLGGEVDIYVIRSGEDEAVPKRPFEDLQTELYRLEGEVEVLTSAKMVFEEREKVLRQENQSMRERLRVAMDEVMRLEARMGTEPPGPKLLENGE